VVEAHWIDQLDGGVVLGEVAQFRGEAGAAVAVQPGGVGGGAARGEESTDVLETFEVADSHDVVPFGFADGEQCFAAAVGLAMDRDVDFVTGLRGRIVDGPAGGPCDLPAVGCGGRVPAGPFAADLFEVRADDLAAEGGLGQLPDGGGASGTLQIAPGGAQTEW